MLTCNYQATYVKLCQKFLPGFPVAHVGVSTEYAQTLADHVPGLGVSILAYALATPVIGPRFVRDMKEAGHPIYAVRIHFIKSPFSPFSTYLRGKDSTL